MSVSRPVLTDVFRALALLIAFAATPTVTVAQEQKGAATPEAGDDAFTVPDGSAADLLKFIQGVSKPTQQFRSDEEVLQFRQQASKAIGDAADKILAGEATDKQAVDAIGWKLESLRIREQLGDTEADKQAEEFVGGYRADKRTLVARAARQMGFIRQMRKWPQLDATQRATVMQTLVSDLKESGVNRDNGFLAIQICDELSSGPDAKLAMQTLNEIAPLYRESKDPAVARLVPMAEGLARRLNLPGNPIEVSGTLLDGSEIDWASYRGKVVLIDFWATWCGPCRAELPNVLENYRAYHDKGFEVVGISLDTDRAAVEQFLQDSGIEWPTLFTEKVETVSDQQESGNWTNPMAERYAITGIPRAILVDQKGNVVSMNARGRELRSLLQKLLGEPTAAQSSAAAGQEEPKTARRPTR
jgi:thiol-disulfide isomerase/thioredoxin